MACFAASDAVGLDVRRSFTCSSDNSLSIWGGGKVQHSGGVARQCSQLSHGRVFPDHDLILAVPVRANNLVHILAPGQVANLATCRLNSLT